MATMNVSLPASMKDWVEAQTETGRYANASDYVRDLIRQDQRRAAEERLADLVREGLQSPIEPDDPVFLRKRREALRRAIAKKRS